MHLPYISHVSPYISVPGAAAELWRADGLGGFYSSYGSNYAYSTPVYISPISPLYLPYGSNYTYSTPVDAIKLLLNLPDISPISRYISPTSPLHLPHQVRARAATEDAKAQASMQTRVAEERKTAL